MARFYGELSGIARATARGGSKTGIDGHIRGWNIGVKVLGGVDETGHDVFYVYQTSGSHNTRKDILLAIVREKMNPEIMYSHAREEA